MEDVLDQRGVQLRDDSPDAVTTESEPPVDVVVVPGEHTGPGRKRSLAVPVLTLVLLAQFCVLLVSGAVHDGPTFDEPAHLASSVALARPHDLNMGAEHPPLVKVLSGWVIAAGDFTVDRGTPEYAERFEFGFGRQLLFTMGNDPERLLIFAQIVPMLFALAGAVFVFGFAADLFGRWGALVSLALYTTNPNVLAHGHVLATDLPMAVVTTASTWALYRAWRDRSIWLVAASAALMGLAFTAKFNVLIVAPVWAGLAAVTLWRCLPDPSRWRRVASVAAGLVAAGLVAVAVVWVVYLAVDPRLRFDRPDLAAAVPSTGLLATIAANLPVPEPARLGVQAIVGFSDQQRAAFLFGDAYKGGRLAFYPAVTLVKTPLAALALAAIGAVALVVRRRWAALAFAALGPAVLFLSASISELNIGIRHVLLTVVAGCLLGGASVLVRWRATPFVVGALVASAMASAWLTAPRFFPYGNVAFGGSERTREHLADSNSDWGQELPHLAEYLATLDPQRPRWVSYFGAVFPEAYGITARDPGSVPPEQVSGYLALSATNYNLSRDAWAPYLERARLLHVVGDTILVFEVREPAP